MFVFKWQIGILVGTDPHKTGLVPGLTLGKLVIIPLVMRANGSIEHEFATLASQVPRWLLRALSSDLYIDALLSLIGHITLPRLAQLSLLPRMPLDRFDDVQLLVVDEHIL